MIEALLCVSSPQTVHLQQCLSCSAYHIVTYIASQNTLCHKQISLQNTLHYITHCITKHIALQNTLHNNTHRSTIYRVTNTSHHKHCAAQTHRVTDTSQYKRIALQNTSYYKTHHVTNTLLHKYIVAQVCKLCYTAQLDDNTHFASQFVIALIHYFMLQQLLTMIIQGGWVGNSLAVTLDYFWNTGQWIGNVDNYQLN